MGYGTMACMDTTAVMSLIGFRSAQHTLCGRRRDALFDLCDALLTAGPVPSPAHLSLQPQHRRGWGSLYDALAIGAISGAEVEALLAAHPLAGGEPIYAVDASVWARCDAPDEPWSCRLLSPLAPFGGQAGRGGLGLSVDCPAGLRTHQLDRSRQRATRPTAGEPQSRRRAPDSRLPAPVACCGCPPLVRL